MNKFFSPNLDQPVLDQLKAKVLVLRRLVLGKGVVHVEAIELDLLQREGAIDKDPAEFMSLIIQNSYLNKPTH